MAQHQEVNRAVESQPHQEGGHNQGSLNHEASSLMRSIGNHVRPIEPNVLIMNNPYPGGNPEAGRLANDLRTGNDQDASMMVQRIMHEPNSINTLTQADNMAGPNRVDNVAFEGPNVVLTNRYTGASYNEGQLYYQQRPSIGVGVNLGGVHLGVRL